MFASVEERAAAIAREQASNYYALLVLGGVRRLLRSAAKRKLPEELRDCEELGEVAAALAALELAFHRAHARLTVEEN